MDISGRPPLQHGSFVSINTQDMWPGLDKGAFLLFIPIYLCVQIKHQRLFFLSAIYMYVYVRVWVNVTIVTWTFRTQQYCSETTNPDVGTNVTVKEMSCV